MHHIDIMRTTVDVEDHLLLEAKQLAAARRTSLTAVLEDSLRAYLAEARRRPPPGRRTPLPVNTRSRPARGIDLDDTSKLLEIE